MTQNSIRWIQRFDSFKRALDRLEEVVDRLDVLFPLDEVTLKIYEDSIIQRFECTQELAWKVMKDFLTYQGETDIVGSRSAFRKALQAGVIDSPEWMRTIEDRNLTSHTYDEDDAHGICMRVRDVYLGLFRNFAENMQARIIDGSWL